MNYIYLQYCWRLVESPRNSIKEETLSKFCTGYVAKNIVIHRGVNPGVEAKAKPNFT